MKHSVLMMSLLALLAACNTMEGLGRDIQGVGKKLEDTAET